MLFYLMYSIPVSQLINNKLKTLNIIKTLPKSMSRPWGFYEEPKFGYSLYCEAASPGVCCIAVWLYDDDDDVVFIFPPVLPSGPAPVTPIVSELSPPVSPSLTINWSCRMQILS